MRNLAEDVQDITNALFAMNTLQSLSNVETLFLTGATGFFGKWLLDSTLGTHIRVYALSRNPDLFLKKYPRYLKADNIFFLNGDVRDFVLPKRVEIQYIIHAATSTVADSSVAAQNELYSSIVDGTKKILEMRAEKLLYVSSGGVYGKQPPTLPQFTEDYKCMPNNAYGHGKLEAERLCSESDIPTVIVRPFAFIGPYLPLDAHFAAGNFINDALHKRPSIINGDGTPLRSYLYPSDLCEWLWKSLIHGEKGEIFNVGSDEAVSILELAQMINEVAGSSSAEIIVKEKSLTNALPARYIPNIDLIKNRLGVTIKVSLKEAIKRTLEFHKEVKSQL